MIPKHPGCSWFRNTDPFGVAFLLHGLVMMVDRSIYKEWMNMYSGFTACTGVTLLGQRHFLARPDVHAFVLLLAASPWNVHHSLHFSAYSVKVRGF